MEIQTKEIIIITFVVVGIFFIAAVFLVLYIWQHNNRKKKHIEEKADMMHRYETEMIKVQMEVEQKTRENLASDLHDNIGQLLSLTNLTLASIQTNDSIIEQKKQAARDLVSRSIKELRQLSRLINGEKILQNGLHYAIRQELDWLGRADYYTIDFISDPVLDNMSNPTKDLFIFRLFQETMNNVIKHADATKINVNIFISGENLHLKISDNGKGMDTEITDTPGSGMGILNMRKRTQLLDGQMRIESKIGEGTLLNFIIPYP